MAVIQLKRGLAATWTAANPILSPGEFGYETDTGKHKVGDGSTHWNSLVYLPLADDLDLKEDAANKGEPDGYASLDGDGLVPLAQLPITNASWSTLEGKPTYVAAGATKADARDAIDAEPVINTGTTGQWFRGDKTWHALTKSDVGLANVDNTSDATRNAATATLTNKTITGTDNTLSAIPQSAITDLDDALGAKEDTANKGQPSGYASLDGGGKVPVSQLPNAIMEYQGLWNASTNTPALADGTGSPGDVYRVSVTGSQDLGSGSVSFAVGDYVIYSPSTSAWEKADTTDAVTTVNGYTGNVSLTKTDLGLGNVDDTSDATKNAATVTLTNKTISGSANTLTNIPQSAVTDLSTDLAAKEVAANKGQADGYASLDSGGRVPMPQLPAGLVVDGVTLQDTSFQFTSGGTSVGDPISLLIASLDGGSPSSTSAGYVDGGTV